MPAGAPVLDVGCGIKKHPGAIGVDRNVHTNADVIADLDHIPFPFRDHSFREVRAIHVIEHVGSVIALMEEFHRILQPGGRANDRHPPLHGFQLLLRSHSSLAP